MVQYIVYNHSLMEDSYSRLVVMVTVMVVVMVMVVVTCPQLTPNGNSGPLRHV